MDNLKDLQSFGFTLPSPAWLFGSLVFGTLGFGVFWYGKKQQRTWTKWIGVALMVYPYAISETWQLYAVGCALCAAIWFVPD